MTAGFSSTFLAYLTLSSLLALLVGAARAWPHARRGEWPAVALVAWVVVTLLAVNAAVAGKLGSTPEQVARFFRPEPISDPAITLLCVSWTWALAGAALVLARRGFFRTPGHTIYALGFAATALLYGNAIRERVVYGDVTDYIRAAMNLARGRPLPARYLYPPLWATLLEPLVPFGQDAIFLACLTANLLAVLVLYVLLVETLARYGYSRPLAALLTCLAMAVNVPVLRTLYYVQINFHVLNLVLLGLLLYPRRAYASAVALALAVHLKVSPIVLVLPFLLARDWRWLCAFAGAAAGIVGLTALANGLAPYAQFVANLSHIAEANALSFRDNSFDSWFRATAWLLGGGHEGLVWGAVAACKVAVVAAALLVVRRSVRSRAHLAMGEPRAQLVYNSFPMLLVLMTIIAPVVWEHHPVFVLLPFLLMLKPASGSGDWVLLLAGYSLVFLLPTFDAYPWSYHRLLGLLIGMVLLHRFAGRGEAVAGPVFSRLQARTG